MTPEQWPGAPSGGIEPETMIVELAPGEFVSGTERTIAVSGGAQTITVPIPPGTVPGSTLSLPGLGAPVEPGGPARDLLLRVEATAPAPPAPRRPRGLLIAAGVVVALLVACGVPTALFLALKPGSDRETTAAPGSSPAVTASPSPTPISTVEYQSLLSATDKTLSESLAKVTAARTPDAVSLAAGNAYRMLLGAVRSLTAIAPPTAAQSGHTALVAALTSLADEFNDAAGRAGEQDLCLGGAATALVSRSTAAAGVRAAAQTLSTADPAQAYQVGTFLPKSTKDSNRRLSNGAYLKRTSGGSGHLQIKNNGSVDIVLSLVPKNGKKATIRVYVRAKKTYTVTGVRDGTYRIYRTDGVDWDSGARAFARDCSFTRHDDTIEFTTTSTQYTIWKLTLATSDGNITASDVNPDEFPG